MDFTEIYKSTLVSFSPGAQFILTSAQDRLIVRRADSFAITRTWLVDAAPSATQSALSAANDKKLPRSRQNTATLEQWITHIGWSCDSEYLLAACAKKGVVNVFKLRDDEWIARIESGTEGLVKAEWAPDGRTILCFSEWGLRVTIWSLVTGSATYIQYPIHLDRGYAFRSDNRYFVLAERHKSKDTLGIYDCANNYKLTRHFAVPTSSMAGLALSPNGHYIALWEGPIDYKLHIVSMTGHPQGLFTPDPDPGFGIKNVAWHPNGKFIAVAGWDDKIHILGDTTWSPVATFELSGRISSSTTIWREPVHWLDSPEVRGFLSYERIRGSQPLKTTKADLTKAYPKSGAVQLAWNLSGDMLLVRYESAPEAIHLYSFPAAGENVPPSLRTVICQKKPVISARWNPVRRGSLALCCGGRSFYTWSDEWQAEDGTEEEVAECVGVPTKAFDTRDVRWAPDGKGVILIDKETFCCAFEVQDE